MDVDQSSQNDAMDGDVGKTSTIKKQPVLEDSGVTTQSMDVASPALTMYGIPGRLPNIHITRVMGMRYLFAICGLNGQRITIHLVKMN